MLKNVQKSRKLPDILTIFDIFAKSFNIWVLTHPNYKHKNFHKVFIIGSKVTGTAILQFSPVLAYSCCGWVKSPIWEWGQGTCTLMKHTWRWTHSALRHFFHLIPEPVYAIWSHQHFSIVPGVEPDQPTNRLTNKASPSCFVAEA